jgi:EAL domain-containing protein (putative c-di-GMP-specific phosphodiesterase class I)
MTMRVEETLRMETSLRDAIASQQFVVYYQPQVDIASGRIIGMEALVRWEHPELGVISPVKFIPLAEETGMILPLGEWVLRTACRDAAQWNRESPEPLRVSVNLSLRQLEQSDLVDRVRQALEDFGLPPELLDLEITESVASRDIASTRTLMLELRDLGVHLSLDDFGTGYSSLSHLSSLPMNTVKIDRSFVRTLLEAPKNAAIARSIIHMAHSLDLRVVAEGVEEAEQLEFLESNRCDLVQGYLYSPPVPASAFGALLKQQNENAETDRRAA